MKGTENFKSLRASEQSALTALSAAYEPLNVTDWLSLVHELDIKDDNHQTFNSIRFASFCSVLLKQGLITEISINFNRAYAIADDVMANMLLRQAIEKGSFFDYLKSVQITFPWNGTWAGKGTPHSLARCLRDVRLAIFQNDMNAYRIARDRAKQIGATDENFRILYQQCFGSPVFQHEWLNKFPSDFRVSVLNALMPDVLENLKPFQAYESFLEKMLPADSSIQSALALFKIYKGDLKAAETLLSRLDIHTDWLRSGLVHLLKGNYVQSIIAYEEGLKLWRKETGKRKGYPQDTCIFFYPFALLQSRDTAHFPKIVEFNKYFEQNTPFKFWNYFDAAMLFQKNDKKSAESLLRSYPPQNSIESLIRIVVCSWVNPEMLVWKFVKNEMEVAEKNGYQWFVLESASYLATSDTPESDQFDKKAQSIEGQTHIKPLCKLLPKTEDWERALSLLSTMSLSPAESNGKKTEVGDSRLAWLADFESKQVQPIEQKISKNGTWSAGRNVALKRLKTEGVPNMTQQDKDIVNYALKTERNNGGWSYGYVEEYVFQGDELWKRLAGHPLIFLLQNPNVSVQLTKDEPHITIQEKGDNIVMEINTTATLPGYQIIKETNTRYKVLEILPKHIQIVRALGGGKLLVPKQKREAIGKAVANLSNIVNVHSDLTEHTEHLPKIEADHRIHAVLVPIGESFRIELFVKPFGNFPPYLPPGKGAEMVYADVDGVRSQTRRNLKTERDAVYDLFNDCPSLAEPEEPNVFEWEINDTEQCLQILLELEKPRAEDKLVIEWPKGERLRISGSAGFDNLKMGIQKDNDWFSLEGNLHVGEDVVLSMQQLMKMMGSIKGNFVEISDGQYIALTEHFRKQLEELRSVLDDKGRFHILASSLVDDFSEQVAELKADNHWKQNLVRLHDAEIYTPELPSTFQAELRAYQLEGFHWLSRLAHWGVGACLADDMGLGKTVQTLAVLVDRAPKGPAMVIAPVSVCRNWVREAERFAPTLNVHLLGTGDRKEMIEEMGPYDLMVVSYGLLQGESELLGKKVFNTIVIDEAQAIKNRTTKRSKAAMSLNADFKVITTGTPIENHLGELWNLFNFINPGLLGSIERFNERYAIPIEKFRDDEKRHQLQKLIRPFVLRRRKNQVLQELPPKTEIVLTVEMSPEERAFYEALRREAVARIEGEDGGITDKRFRILAELTKLRLACCHPKLVQPTTPLSSSKLELFGETVAELLENNHKVLVFSQFVMHLGIIQSYLKQKNIHYQYLDGSTPPAERQKNIDAFQRGEGDIFLISLKAGGTGLNLTAADYVIHLDPWWNPAVEDQASDRAHRIGQLRPVTVYRLVTEGTVEEKILKLHEQKRDLADSLLSTADTGGRLSAEDLLDLIRNS